MPKTRNLKMKILAIQNNWSIDELLKKQFEKNEQKTQETSSKNVHILK
jgi:hypothetical protein